MCTVSIITFGKAGSYRVVCNRDESRLRAPPSQPRWRATQCPGRGAIWPMDLEAGGTWIAASDRGLCLCLLNLNLEPPPAPVRGARSRGLVIPELIDSPDPRRAME